MRTAVYFVVLLCIVAIAQSCGSSTSQGESKANPKPARGERRTQVFDFGTARQGAILHHTFQVTNTGTEPVKVTRVQTTCGCTVANVEKNTVVEPGKSLEVPVDLNLRGKKNLIESKVIVNYAEGGVPDELILKGTVPEEYPSTLEIPKIKRGEQPEQVVTLATYPGQPSLAVQGIEFDAAKFTVTSKVGSKDGTVDIVVKPATTIPFGSVVDKIVVNTNDAEAPEKTIAVRAHVLKPLEAASPQLVLRPSKEGEPVVGIAEFTSSYGEPITDITIAVTKEKRFSAELEAGTPPNTVRVRITASPPPKAKKSVVQGVLTVSASVAGDDTDARMTLIYSTGNEEVKGAERVDDGRPQLTAKGPDTDDDGNMGLTAKSEAVATDVVQPK